MKTHIASLQKPFLVYPKIKDDQEIKSGSGLSSSKLHQGLRIASRVLRAPSALVVLERTGNRRGVGCRRWQQRKRRRNAIVDDGGGVDFAETIVTPSLHLWEIERRVYQYVSYWHRMLRSYRTGLDLFPASFEIKTSLTFTFIFSYHLKTIGRHLQQIQQSLQSLSELQMRSQHGEEHDEACHKRIINSDEIIFEIFSWLPAESLMQETRTKSGIVKNRTTSATNSTITAIAIGITTAFTSIKLQE
ncbi:hypothetical protein RND71_014688 [Anisodus tanguticus]|uniref:Uncharacterized protein n=1 Tax=Anisodus tanguticus TaxID=243964 RepID=A0AAE1SA49_9SOLA|nr:hypothetical protein RND71_014688 [Anisodus tanguticus]